MRARHRASLRRLQASRVARDLRRAKLCGGAREVSFRGSGLTDFEIIAREVSGYRTRLEAIEKRLSEVEKVNERLEEAALTSARALGEISGHWDAVYEAMRRKDESQEA